MKFTPLLLCLLCAVARADLSMPAMESRPGAPNTIYLDFHGEPAGINWGGIMRPAPTFDTDGDPTNFSASELAGIQAIFSITSAAYAPFNVDVTTVDPGNWTSGALHQVRECIGGDSGWTGQAFGGLSNIGSMTSNFINDSHTGFVFPAELGDNIEYTGDAVVHEAGHAAGLDHQAVWSGGQLVSDYRPGVWMGVAYGFPNPTWTTGLTPAGVFQDDVQLLDLSLGTVPEPSAMGFIAVVLFTAVFGKR